MLTRMIPYLRNKLHSWLFPVRQRSLSFQKIKNIQSFTKALDDQTDTLHRIDFKEGYSIFARGKDLNGVTEACLFEDYTKNVTVYPGMTIYDLGSCIGDFAVLAAYRGANVIAVEPDVRNFAILKKNIEANNLVGQIIPLNIAVSMSSGISGFDNTAKNTGGYSLSEDAPVKVETKTIQQLMSEHGHTHIDLLKIDIEGGEYNIFQNKETSSIADIRVIVGEYHLDSQKPEYSWKNLRSMLSGDFHKLTRRFPYYFEAYK